ncbi:MAG: type II toxin-antitoxin system HicB family antitoxin [Thermoleophilia bacterium]|nr:type II toxin-antitoxin system HicB family antitoxin [Thermoleophilia bacterium]
MRYLMVIEEGPGNLSAYVPDLPGCVATGANLEELRANMRDAVLMHIAGMKEDGLAVPEPTPSSAELLEVA